MREKNKGLYEWLPEGKQNGVTGRAIMDAFGLSSKRALYALVEQERNSGKPVLCIHGRYFRSNKAIDFEECYHAITSRALGAMKSARAIYACKPTESTGEPGQRARAGQIPGQMTFDEYMLSRLQES